MSQQIPTMALMKDGECVEIRPEVLSNGKLRRFHFSEGKSYFKLKYHITYESYYESYLIS